jgi:hypothetical protein
MNTASKIRLQQPTAGHSQRIMAVDFKDLQVNDIILIGTRNTCYSFVLTSERGMRGNLSGDTSNNFFPEAVLIGSLVKEGEHVQLLMSRLEPRAHALFFVKQGEQLLEILTSSITSLCCVRPISN